MQYIFENKNKWLRQLEDAGNTYTDKDGNKRYIGNHKLVQEYPLDDAKVSLNKHGQVSISNKPVEVTYNADDELVARDGQKVDLLFELSDLKKKLKSLEQAYAKVERTYNNAMQAIDYPITDYKTIEDNRQIANKANNYLTILDHKIKAIKSSIAKKTIILNKL